jgi:hypothetical protein
MPRDVARLDRRGTRRRGRWCSGCPPRTFGWGESGVVHPAFARLPSVPVHYKRARRASYTMPPLLRKALLRRQSETATRKAEPLTWCGCPQPFPSRRDREFESVSLRQRVVWRPRLREEADCSCGASRHGHTKSRARAPGQPLIRCLPRPLKLLEPESEPFAIGIIGGTAWWTNQLPRDPFLDRTNHSVLDRTDYSAV